jgi:hypothetical protein
VALCVEKVENPYFTSHRLVGEREHAHERTLVFAYMTLGVRKDVRV